MLAQPSEDGLNGIDIFEDTIGEYKVDGARVQIHKDARRVEIYSRQLNVVTARVPELAEFANSLRCDRS